MLTTRGLRDAVGSALAEVTLEGWGPRTRGKVRDLYRRGAYQILIATDRVSAFDRVLGLIPYKGQVLNQLSAWWFRQTDDLVANHLLDTPDPNVTVARAARPLPVEIVVRGYLTGVTDTSLWTLYSQGERRPYGLDLPPGLQRNDPLPAPVITPTTKAARGEHDQRLSRQSILDQGLLDVGLYTQIETTALALFARGQALARRAGLVLVDTKYEFGLVNGELCLIDELHTPDSSRYWEASSTATGEPENLDKEYLRRWYAARGYRGDGPAPPMPAEFVAQVAGRYIAVLERLTGQAFDPAPGPAPARIQANLDAWATTQPGPGKPA